MCSSASDSPWGGSGQATAVRGQELRLRCWSELEGHLATVEKRAHYRKLLAKLGVDPDAAEVRGLGDRQAVLLAEQPGSWLTPRDLIRARLLERIVERGKLDAQLSGARSLEQDRFTGVGEKGVLLDFQLHRQLGPVRMLGSHYVKHYEHRTYASLPIGAKSYVRMRTIWDYSLQMIEAAAVSPRHFVDVLKLIFDAGPLKGARDILPGNNDPSELLAVGEDLAQCRLEPAFKALWPARANLVRDIRWDVYWNQLDSEFLGMPVTSLSPLLARFLLAVVDPVRLGRRLQEEIGAAPDEPVPVAGLAAEDDTFRTVQFDPRRESFFFLGRKGARTDVSWDALRRSAEQNGSARPSGVPEYLLLAAFGFYLLVDCGDSVQPFHESVCAIHARHMGIRYPWITFDVHESLGPGHACFTDVFRPGFVELTVDAMSGFLER